MKGYPEHLSKLIQVLKKLPGVGSRSAERFAFHLLKWRPEELQELASAIQEVPKRIKQCPACGCLIGERECFFCDSRRNSNILCIIASPRDAFSIEETHEYDGLYHVLGGLLSPMNRKGPEHLSLDRLKERIENLGVKEVIIALDSTLEGDATALYLKQELPSTLHISRLAFGLPMGSHLDFVDGGTLARAFSGRHQF
jgi:recombination protein RecR